METIVKVLDYEQPDQQIIEEAGKILKEGGLVAFPTETVYGLGGDALNPESSKKIYAAKGRPSDNPLIVHIADKEDLYKIAAEVSETAEKLMDAFWPGPLTMIFPKKEIVPDQTTGGLDTVAVRMPSDTIAAAMIRAAGGFVAAPSANVSGRPSCTTAAHVQGDLDGRIEMILDGGRAVIGLESTIVDVSVKKPVILRPGFITQEMLSSVIGEVTIDRAIIAPDSGLKPKAPGMKYRHYAPKADLTVVEGEREAVIAKINALAKEAKEQGMKVGIIAAEETKDLYLADYVRCVGSRAHEEEIAANLYDILRDFDATDAQLIYSESFADARIGSAIMNRLLKAAGHKVISV